MTLADDGIPKRIQRQRTRGWRMPENAVYVGRPTKWGNPAKVGDSFGVKVDGVYWEGRKMTRADAMRWYQENVTAGSAIAEEARTELRGKDLCCWCPLDQPCHADVLLELANAVRYQTLR